MSSHVPKCCTTTVRPIRSVAAPKPALSISVSIQPTRGSGNVRYRRALALCYPISFAADDSSEPQLNGVAKRRKQNEGQRTYLPDKGSELCCPGFSDAGAIAVH